MDYKPLFAAFMQNANPKRAAPMSAYMRNQFAFLGISAPKRKELSREFLKAASGAESADWEFVNVCWQMDEREFQYLATDYLRAVKRVLSPRDVPDLRRIAVQKSWWDTIDGMDRLLGHIALNFPHIKETLLKWSLDDNFWLRRIAIDHQLLLKEKTDTALLEQIIINNLGQSEFFINKAIGWSLRDYSKTNPAWVRAFIQKHGDRLSPLSIREAGKYL